MEISTRERFVIRAAVVVAIVLALWMFGLARGPAFVY